MASCPIPANRTPYRPTPAEYNKASPFILSPNTEEELEAIQIEHKNRLLILVFTTAWCKNCKRLSDGIEQLAEDLSKIATFVHVDVDELVRTVKKHNVDATPTFAISRGHVLQSIITAAQLPRKATYEEMDDQLLEWISTTVRSFSEHWNGSSYSKITDHLAFAPTPTEAQIHDGLINVGFKTVIGMESKQNPGEYLAKEKDIWADAGVKFVSYPIKVIIHLLTFYCWYCWVLWLKRDDRHNNKGQMPSKLAFSFLSSYFLFNYISRLWTHGHGHGHGTWI
ncbi:MAG: hypothetical protein J3R72DRAFT_444746 [Linnemannia gamsii]|nr:MAG: hypothetical protein J3R72DRAFT_444746 [Linnemannia gamsii]